MKIDLRHLATLSIAAAGLLLGGCAVMPMGPSVMALPGSAKSAEEYQADVAQCQQHAAAVLSANTGAVANANNAAANNAAASTAFGAATGAIIGAATGQAGQGAAIGAGLGLLFGGLASSSYGSMSSYQLQRGYDGAYLQCMYSHGNKVPMPRQARAPSNPTYSSAPEVGHPPPNTPAPLGYPPRDAAPPANMRTM
jgi:hypothetical protein